VTWTEKDRGPWLGLATLTALLVVLAVLQYRWVSEIGRAEAGRRQAQIGRATSRFARAFDREVGEVLTTFFRGAPGPRPADPRELLLAGLAQWRTNEHAALVSQVLLATASPTGEFRLEACAADGSAFHEVPWTPELVPFRQRLDGAEDGRPRPFVRPGSLLDPPLALVLPILGGRGEGPPRREQEPLRFAGVALVQLDLRYMREQLLPQLAEAHFGPLAESEFVVAVVRRADRALIFSSDRKDGVGARPGDLERSLPGDGAARRAGPTRAGAALRRAAPTTGAAPAGTAA
jgi:hypothetical protein